MGGDVRFGEHVDAPVDPYLPRNGNRGYRASRYELDLTYQVHRNRLAGKATITAVTTESRSRYRFDLAQNLHVTRVTARGGRGTWRHHGGKLVVTPAQRIPAGGVLVVTVEYAGSPEPIRSIWGEVGWEELSEGVIVAGQPNGAPSWFPCDDHPGSKASYRIAITTDSPYHVVANGALVHKRTRAGRTTWVYEQSEPMASYLATIAIGPYEHRQIPSGRVPMFAVHPPRLRSSFDLDFGRQLQMMEVFGTLFGPYPFAGYTVVVTDDDLEIPIEAQGLSIFGANHCTGRRAGERLVAHELAHQWFGNSLTIRQWRDIWLHEGFACYAEWLWSENSGGRSAHQLAVSAYQGLARKPRDLIVGDPGPHLMFDDRIYTRGALTLHVLRSRLGDDNFFTLLRCWTQTYRHSSVTAEQFTDLAAHYTDTPLRRLWETWLGEKELPPL
ncbi:M1 family metallopeptidase [Rhodococcus sp. T2V]|uniref:M1 family metallopeptidase n=1 Tax=Rhodococcus sp. T2V TaxID=3034164 RepID=UPI0023E27FFB|nr:M1 family metallopeptidase [Rhodococcus sp. T2V]